MNYQDKSLLPYDSTQTFLEKILSEAENFSEILISKNTPLQLSKNFVSSANLKIIKDLYLNCGPLGGLHSGLLASENDYIFVTTCDTPNITKEFIHHIIQTFLSEKKYDIITVRDSSGRVHPLCGIYKKSLTEKIKTQLEEKQFRVMTLLEGLNVKILDLQDSDFDSGYILKNFNTPEDL